MKTMNPVLLVCWVIIAAIVVWFVAMICIDLIFDGIRYGVRKLQEWWDRRQSQ